MLPISFVAGEKCVIEAVWGKGQEARGLWGLCQSILLCLSASWDLGDLSVMSPPGTRSLMGICLWSVCAGGLSAPATGCRACTRVSVATACKQIAAGRGPPAPMVR
eukprot:scaffold128776_cov23-Tisochrysis_lutea.AAC.1